MIILISVVFGLLFVLPWVAEHVWPSLDKAFSLIWEDPTDKAARRMLKAQRKMHVIPEMTDTGQLEMLAAQTGIPSKDILRSINALSPSEAAAIFQAIKTAQPLGLIKILKILEPKQKAPRMPRKDGY